MAGHNRDVATVRDEGFTPKHAASGEKEDDAGIPNEPAHSPEHVAKTFLREGGVVVYDGREQSAVRRRRLFAAGAIGVLAVAAVLVAVALIAARGGTAPQSSAAPAAHTSTTLKKGSEPALTTPPPPAPSAVSVDVLNASQSDGVAGHTAAGLTQDGFAVSAVGNAPSKIASGNPSTILYGPAGLPAAHTLAASLSGAVALVANPMLTGNHVVLWVANPQLTVSSSTTSTTTSPPRSNP